MKIHKMHIFICIYLFICHIKWICKSYALITLWWQLPHRDAAQGERSRVRWGRGIMLHCVLGKVHILDMYHKWFDNMLMLLLLLLIT